jgi:uncharacterized cupredoxin-like copper-binding protein
MGSVNTRGLLLTCVGVVLLAGAAASVGYAGGLERAGGEEPPDPVGMLGPDEATVLVDIEHSRFEPAHLVVAQGTEVRFVLVNHDPITHELIVGGPEVHERHSNGTEARHAPRPGEVSVEAGDIASTTYQFDEPGDVTMACHLPRHLEYGMVGHVEVIEG